MTHIMFDIEADGPVPGLYSMIEIGAVVVENNLQRKFFGQLRPITENWKLPALESINRTREETFKYNAPELVMNNLYHWVTQFDKPKFISDNNGFDWAFINYYFHKYCNENPFGFSSMNLGCLYKGCVKDVRRNFKHLRDTKHTHNALDDAMGNAEAMIKIVKQFHLNINI